MNKTLLSAALVAGLGMVALAPQAANATDGTININGKITAQSCTVQVNGAVSPATITLPTVSTSALNGIGTTAGQTPFKINLSACAASPVITSAATYFEAGPGVNAAGRLANTEPSATAATGVDVELVNNDNSVVNVGAAAPTSGAGVASISANAATLSYYARYYATAATVGAGKVTTSVQFSMIYQ
jgi:major type 1 subunit fimbrin (pilin)